jgi:hypothetical protein
MNAMKDKKIQEAVKPQVKYEGHVPKTLRDWCDKHPERVREVVAGGGYNTDSGFAYDVALRRGWRAAGEVVHSFVEETAKETLSQLRGVKACDCSDCKTGIGW